MPFLRWRSVFCKECLRNGRGDIISQKAAEKWNTRTPDEKLEAENARLREALERIADVGSWKKYNDVLYIGDKPLYKVAFDALKGNAE